MKKTFQVELQTSSRVHNPYGSQDTVCVTYYLEGFTNLIDSMYCWQVQTHFTISKSPTYFRSGILNFTITKHVLVKQCIVIKRTNILYIETNKLRHNVTLELNYKVLTRMRSCCVCMITYKSNIEIVVDLATTVG